MEILSVCKKIRAGPVLASRRAYTLSTVEYTPIWGEICRLCSKPPRLATLSTPGDDTPPVRSSSRFAFIANGISQSMEYCNSNVPMVPHLIKVFFCKAAYHKKNLWYTFFPGFPFAELFVGPQKNPCRRVLRVKNWRRFGVPRLGSAIADKCNSCCQSSDWNVGQSEL